MTGNKPEPKSLRRAKSEDCLIICKLQVPAADIRRYRQMFKKLDANNDGKLEISELIYGLASHMKGLSDEEVLAFAEEIFLKADSNKNREVDFAEFVTYMQSHENKLRSVFMEIDKDGNGKLEADEVYAALMKLGIKCNYDDAEALIKRVDKDGDLAISWEEWRDFFSLIPESTLKDLMKYWRFTVMLDLGLDMSAPADFTKTERKAGLWWRHLFAGAIAGVVSRTCTAPLDRLKIYLQVHGGTGRSLWGTTKYMIEEGGFRSLWRGNGVNVIKIAPESGLRFAAFEHIKALITGREDRPITLFEKFIAGGCAGAIGQSCIFPLETIKTRLACMNTGEYNGIIDCGRQIVKQNGFIGLFKGYFANLYGIIPYSGIDLTVYETLKALYVKRHPENSPGIVVYLSCGTIAGSTAQFCAYPFTVIRTKLQAQSTPEARVGTMHLTKHIWKTEGIKGFYSGVIPNFLKVIPAVSISYAVYEYTKPLLGI